MRCCRSSDGAQARMSAVHNLTNQGEVVQLQALSPPSLSHFHCYCELGCAFGIPKRGHGTGAGVWPGALLTLVLLCDRQQSRGAEARVTIPASHGSAYVNVCVFALVQLCSLSGA